MELVVLWLFFAVLTPIVATAKGRSGVGWFLLGLVFGLLALIVVVVLPSLKPPEQPVKPIRTTVDPEPDSSTGLKRCPNCAEEIRAEAKLCRFCQTEFVSG
jgi:hypothetical protein